MNNKPNWDGMSEQLKEHGVRNVHIMCEAPVPKPQPIMNCTPGVEPFPFHNFGSRSSEENIELEAQMQIIDLSSIGGDLESIRKRIYERAFDSVNVVRPDMGYGVEGGIMRDSANIYCARTHGKSVFLDTVESNHTKIHMLKNLYYGIEIQDPILISKEDSTTKPPKGRSQKSHNLIQAMNKRKR